MLAGYKLRALVQRSKTFTLNSHLKGWSPSFKASNEPYSLLHSLRSNPCGNSPISRYSSLYGSKFISKNLNVPSTRKMTTSAAVLHSAKAEAANSGIKLLVLGPQAQQRVAIWLFGCSFWVYCIIAYGEVIYLNRSMLSMTDSKFKGEILQLTDEEWNHEYEKYMQSPGYKWVKSLSDFRYIHRAEYVHRMMGRGLGIVFGLPFAYFLAKGYITRPLGLRLSLLFALGGAQALFGCSTIVKSGLEKPTSEYVQPRASPYRYAMHTTSAFILHCGIFWTALSVMVPEPPTSCLKWVRGAVKLRKFVLPACALVGVTGLSGAFVTGNGAGCAFNTFPKMGDTWIPDDIFNMEPLFRNFFENASTVQLTHRILATATSLSIASLWWTSRKLELHPLTRIFIQVTLGMALLQVISGGSPLLCGAPGSPGSVQYQAGALTLMSCMMGVAHSVRKPSPRVLKLLQDSLPNMKS